MKIKDARTTLGPAGAHPAIIHAADVVDRVWRRVTGHHARIVGLAEEGHSEGSRHYGTPSDPRCMAVDFDADEVAATAEQRAKIAAELLTRLGDLEYDFVWETLGTPRAHLHLEWDPS